MKTSNERRRVAERLRELASSDYTRYAEPFCEQLTDIVDFPFDGTNKLPNVADNLADLIDPTCRDIGDSHMFACSKCGCELDVDDREGEPTMWDGGAPAVPRYCPNCKSRVVRGDE